jgi:hypothetical protein
VSKSSYTPDRRFVSLQERTTIANRESADLFPRFTRTPARRSGTRRRDVLLNFANNSQAAAVAARENAASGQAMGAPTVRAIALNNKLDESAELAIKRAAIDDRAAPASEQVSEGSRRQAGAVCRPHRCGHAERAGGSPFVTNTQEATAHERLTGSGSRRALLSIKKFQTSLQRRQRRSK